jgi:subtilisin
VSIRPRVRRPGALAVRALAMLLVPLLVSPLDGAAAVPPDEARRYIVTLAVADAARTIDPASRTGRQRLRRRATRTRTITDRLEADVGFASSQRFSYAVPGFAASLSPRQAARLRRDPRVAGVRPARRYRLAAQTVPTGVLRVKAAPVGAPGPDVDADVAILDTGVGPVGGGELNVQGGINCSGDSLGANAWLDAYPSRHGTHVAGIVAARDNGVGVVGVAPGARLWSVRVFRASGFGDEGSIICGLDWVLATHGPTPPPGSQPIEVVNMSLQGPRPGNDPPSCEGRPVPDPDPIHLAVCAVHAAGISVVVAAGNDGQDARFTSPAGYDQVITVGALSDFDGRPGGRAAATCAATIFGAEKDDRFARYSNRGPDVDILAPGTCILSTRPSGTGDMTARMTGTSMAAPHVTGAVARYLSASPGTQPERMRRLIRAAGRLDWEIRSDPDWSGPSSDGAPQRLLDVEALMGPAGLRAWIHPRRLVAARAAAKRHVRVDIQRRGGLDDDVELALDGLPGEVGSASFDPGGSQSGLLGLGARLGLDLDRSGPDGVFPLGVTADAGWTSHGTGLDLVVDRSGPRIRGPEAAIRGGRSPLGNGNVARVRVTWSARDALGTVRRNMLQRRSKGGSWKTLAKGAGLARRTLALRPGAKQVLRVRSLDSRGNASVSEPLPLHLLLRDSASTRWMAPASGWQREVALGAIGGSVLTTRERGMTLSTDFSGRAVALVAPLGPGAGRLRVRIDEGRWRTVELSARRAQGRRVVFSRRVAPGAHRLEVQALRGLVAVDAVLILR